MFVVPTVPVSCGALVRDQQGRLLILKPTYKSGWTIPGGIMEADGETPWEACRREVREETGLEVSQGRLVAVDTRGAKRDEQLGLRFLFDCARVDEAAKDNVVVQASEVEEARWLFPDQALPLLRPRIARRVAAALASSTCVYLEDGHPVAGVTA